MENIRRKGLLSTKITFFFKTEKGKNCLPLQKNPGDVNRTIYVSKVIRIWFL